MSESFDEKMAARLQAQFDKVLSQLEEAATSEITAWTDEPCPKCGCQHRRAVRTPDWNLKLKVMEWMANRGFGRPSQRETEVNEDRIVFRRLTVSEPLERFINRALDAKLLTPDGVKQLIEDAAKDA